MLRVSIIRCTQSVRVLKCRFEPREKCIFTPRARPTLTRNVRLRSSPAVKRFYGAVNFRVHTMREPFLKHAGAETLCAALLKSNRLYANTCHWIRQKNQNCLLCAVNPHWAGFEKLCQSWIATRASHFITSDTQPRTYTRDARYHYHYTRLIIKRASARHPKPHTLEPTRVPTSCSHLIITIWGTDKKNSSLLRAVAARTSVNESQTTAYVIEHNRAAMWRVRGRVAFLLWCGAGAHHVPKAAKPSRVFRNPTYVSNVSSTLPSSYHTTSVSFNDVAAL